MAIVRVVGLLWLFAGVIGAAGPAAAELATADRDELTRFQGTWQLIAVERDGAPVPDERIHSVRVTITGDTHTVRFGDQVIARDVRFAIDPSKSPKEVTDTLGDGPDQGKLIRGIYRLEGDTLVSCTAGVDKDRPTEFRSRAGSGWALRVFRRVKDDDPRRETAIGAELRKFTGVWRIESMDIGGRTLRQGDTPNAPRMTIDGARFTLVDSRGSARGVYSVDPTASPKTIDVVFLEGPRAGKVTQGVYALEGDTYTAYAGVAGQPRPAALPREAAQGYVLQVLKREKP